MNICIYGFGVVGKSLAINFLGFDCKVLVVTNSEIKSTQFSSEYPLIEFTSLESIMNDEFFFQSVSILILCMGSYKTSSINEEKLLVDICRLAVKSHSTKVFLISSVAVYGNAVEKLSQSLNGFISTSLIPNPISSYAKKIYSRELCLFDIFKNSETNFVIVRIPMVIDVNMKTNLFRRLHKILRFGFFPYPGLASSCLPCIRSSVLALKLFILFNQSFKKKYIYQFSENLYWIEIFHLYEKKIGKKIYIFSIPILFLKMFNFLKINKLNYYLKVFSNNLIYKDDFNSIDTFSFKNATTKKIESISIDTNTIDILWRFLDKK